MRITISRMLGLVAAALVVGLVVYAFMPVPLLVDIQKVERGPLEVTVGEEGVTRIREVYRVSSPIVGRMLRSSLEVGDYVAGADTVVATIQPVDPSFLDARTRQELEAVVAATKAAVALAEAQLHRIESELTFARSELERAEALSRTETISPRTLQKARLDVDTKEAEVASARANLELKRRELESAQARLIGPETPQVHEPQATQCCVRVYAPADGRVLEIFAESEQVLQAGAPLLDIGDPNDLELVVELLSRDAVKVKEGAAAYVESWGGPGVLSAAVRRVDPAGFMKVSALGIEEQRVNVILDLTDPPERWRGLGHEFRVYVRIIVWQGADVLRVPVSALFRQGDAWAVFVLEDGVARLRTIEIDHRNSTFAEVLSGLDSGAQVILHPSDQVADGVGVEQRVVD